MLQLCTVYSTRYTGGAESQINLFLICCQLLLLVCYLYVKPLLVHFLIGEDSSKSLLSTLFLSTKGVSSLTSFERDYYTFGSDEVKVLYLASL